MVDRRTTMRGQIEKVEQLIMPRKKTFPEFAAGDTVRVFFKLKEGGKDRQYSFEGIVIARKHAGLGESFTVRGNVQGEGVERTFMINAPNLTKILILKRGKVNRSKLYYLRKAKGKRARIEEIFLSKEQQKALDDKLATATSEQDKKQAPEPAKETTTEAKK